MTGFHYPSIRQLDEWKPGFRVQQYGVGSNSTSAFWLYVLQVIGKIGPLEYILNTPSHHRVHHGVNRYCIDKNFAGVFIIWDRVFGKFALSNKQQEMRVSQNQKPLSVLLATLTLSVGVGRKFGSVCLSVYIRSITQKRMIPKCLNLV